MGAQTSKAAIPDRHRSINNHLSSRQERKENIDPVFDYSANDRLEALVLKVNENPEDTSYKTYFLYKKDDIVLKNILDSYDDLWWGYSSRHRILHTSGDRIEDVHVASTPQKELMMEQRAKKLKQMR